MGEWKKKVGHLSRYRLFIVKTRILMSWGKAGKLRRSSPERHDEDLDVAAECVDDVLAVFPDASPNAHAGDPSVERSKANFTASIACFRGEYLMHEILARSMLGTHEILWGDATAAHRQLAAIEKLLADTPESRLWWVSEVVQLRADVAIHDRRLTDATQILLPLREQADIPAELLAEIETRLGQIAYLEGDPARALDHLATAERHGAARGTSVQGIYAFSLARSLHALGREPERVEALLTHASAVYIRLGKAYAGRLAEVHAWRPKPSSAAAPPPIP